MIPKNLLRMCKSVNTETQKAIFVELSLNQYNRKWIHFHPKQTEKVIVRTPLNLKIATAKVIVGHSIF